MKSTLGFIGLGLMGSPMASRLLKAGFSVSVYNRAIKKSTPLAAQGASLCDSPRAVAEKSEVVFTMLSNSEALAEVAGGNNGVMAGLKKGDVHVDLSTVSPETTKELSERYRTAGCHFLHSPVLGSVPEATDGTLLLFVGGSEDAYRRARPALEILGGKAWRFERPEQASYAKLFCNMFIAGMAATLVQGLVFSQKADVDAGTLLDILAHSALNAPMYQTKGKSILERNFAPRFFVEHMLKDIRLMLKAAEHLDVTLPVTEAAEKLFSEAVTRGFGKEDYSAVIKVLEQRAGIEVRKI